MFIELIVGIAIVMLTLVGVVSLSTQSTKTGRIAGDRNKATTYAESYLEKLRRERDVDPGSFFSVPRSSGSCDSEVEAPYTCEVNYQWGVNTVTVSVTVSWVDGENTYNVNEKTILTNNQ